jgi:hypothetical protein
MGKKALRIAVMPARALVFVSKRLQPPAAAFLCIAMMQLVMLAVAPRPEAPLPMGAVRVSITR